MSTLMQYLTMGKYGLYVWPAYGIAMAVLVINFVGVHIQGKKTKQQLKRWYQQ